MASIPVAAARWGGSVRVDSGSSTARRGYMGRSATWNLMCSSRSLITAAKETSDPVPAVVGRQASGASSRGRPRPSSSRGGPKYPSHSRGSPPWVKITFAALAVSMTDPPPTARMASAPCSRAASAAAMTAALSESWGTASKMPATARPPSAMPACTPSISPVARIPSSVMTRTRLAPSLENSNPSPSISPRPAITRVGATNW